MIKKINFYNFEKGYGWLEGKKKIKINKNDNTVLNYIIVALKTKIGIKFNSRNMIVGLEPVLFIKGAKAICSETIHEDMKGYVKAKYGVAEVENLSLCYTQEKVLEIAQELSTWGKFPLDIEEYKIIRDRVSESKWHTEKYCCYSNWGYEKPLIKYVYEDIYNIGNGEYTTVYSHKGFESESLKQLESLVGIKPTKCSHSHTDGMADSYDLLSD